MPFQRTEKRVCTYFMSAKRLFFMIVLTVTLAACAAQEPFVLTEGEFNRLRVGFGQEPTDRTEVVICYASNATTPATLRDLAAGACGQVGKRAVFKKHLVSACPLVTPSAAAFDCVSP